MSEELKTLKEIEKEFETVPEVDYNRGYFDALEICKKEAIKWYTVLTEKHDFEEEDAEAQRELLVFFIKTFFNLTEEELK